MTHASTWKNSLLHGRPSLDGTRRPISPILYCYSIVIVNRDTIFSVAIRDSYFAPAPTESQMREFVIASTRLSSCIFTVTSMRPTAEEVIDADPAADLAAEEENKLINEVHIDHPHPKEVAC